MSFWENFIFAIGIIVANVPEGLLPTVTLSLAMGAQRMAKRNILVRRLSAVETLGATNVICTDKTGTLTQNKMSVQAIYIGGERIKDDFSNLAQQYPYFFKIAAFCHDLKISNIEGNISALGDPMEIAIWEMSHSARGTLSTEKILYDIPFDAERKRQTVVIAEDQGSVVLVKGTPEGLLPLCSRINTKSGIENLTELSRQTICNSYEDMTKQGLRILAFAWKPTSMSLNADSGHLYDQELEQDLIFAGVIGLEDPYRPRVPEAIATCHKAGIRVIMITGDHPHTALSIGQQIGLVKSPNAKVLTGPEVSQMSASLLQLALRNRELIFARMTPEDKAKVVAVLKQRGDVVAVTGDGVNDAPALRMADIGIAMGKEGTDVAREASDMVLADDDFASIVSGIEEGRTVYSNIRKFLTYILTSNVPELIPYLGFVLFRIPLGLTIMQILAVDLGTDLLPALGLGAENPEPDVMDQRPRKKSERLLTFAVLMRAYFFLGIFQAVAAMTTFLMVLHHGGWTFGGPPPSDLLYRQATSACFAAIVITQIFNVFICRSRHRSVFAASWLSNRLILAGILVEAIILAFIVLTSVGQTIFNTAPFSIAYLGIAIGIGVLMVSADEVRKFLNRRTRKQGA